MSELPSPMHAQDKLAFLLALVPYLADHDRVSVSDVADHFHVTTEHIRSAIRLIAVSGVPGDTNQYLPGDLFDIAWDDFEHNDQIVLTHRVAIDDSPRFSAHEAAALIAGLQYISALPENANRTATGRLMAKLSRGASAPPSELAVATSNTDASLRVIRSAVAAATAVEFDYVNSRGRHERRTVDPLRIESLDQDWYLRGWCHRRAALRTFRIDRMVNVTGTNEPISRKNDDVTLPETLFEASPDDVRVVLDVAECALPLIADYSPLGLEPSGVAGRVLAPIRVAHFHGLKRLVARLSGTVVVHSPSEARREVANWAAAGEARYANLDDDLLADSQ